MQAERTKVIGKRICFKTKRTDSVSWEVERERMEASTGDGSPVHTRVDPTAPSTVTPISPSLGITSSFFVHHAAHMPARTAVGGAGRSLAPSQQSRLPRGLSPSCGRWSHASPVTVHMNAVASSSAPPDDASRLPLDLLEPAAARWASTASRGGRRAPRVRSTLGPQSEVVDTGVFVSPNTVVAALYSAAPGRAHIVVTAESGGWLRVREQQTGAIRHQQQLRDGGELSCLAWASAARDAVVEPFGAVVVAGQLSGLISFYALVGESLVELPSATCVFHEAPLLTCVPLPAPASAVGPAAPKPRELVTALLSVDADGVVALWRLEAVETGGGAGRRGDAEACFSVLLLDCRHASKSPPERCPANAQVRNGEGASPLPPSLSPPVVMAATTLSHASTSPCCVLSTHCFAQGRFSPADTPSDGDDEADARDSAAVFLYSFTASTADGAPAADPNATTLVGETGTSTSLEDGVPVPSGTQACFRRGWEVLRVYRVPVALMRQRDGGSRAASAGSEHVIVTALCITGCVSRSGSAVPAEHLWAGTADGRLLVWEARTGQFVRCLQSASAAPVHGLTSVPPPGSAGQAQVWASQADGSVVAWSADTYTVSEVLPVSYPPPSVQVSGNGDAEGSMGGADPADKVITVCDAVDLLSATRHRCALLASSAPWRRGCGFTLFMEPMAQVCMQRAWSVATDGTVRTWLLPTGSVCSDGAVASTSAASAASAPTNDAEGATHAALLDGYTVQRYLQDRADALVRERQARRMAAEAQQEQLRALQERNRVLAAALQQAISRLERVSVDALVRSASRPGSSPPTTPSQDKGGAGATPAEAAVLSPDSSATATTSKAALSDAVGPEERPAVAAQTSTAVVMPEAAAPTQQPLATLLPAAQVHVQTIQGFLEELHAKFEESWSRNNALREELLVYQLRTLEREEDMVRRLRMAAASKAAAAFATVGSQEPASRPPEVAATAASTPAASPLLPSLHTTASFLSEGTHSSCAQAADRGHGDRAQTPPPPQSLRTPNATRASATGRSTPSRALCSPSVEELVRSRVSPARPLTPPPLLEMLLAEVSSTSSGKPDVTSPSSIEASPNTSTAVERFFEAASAMLHPSTLSYGGAARRAGGTVGRARVPAPPAAAATTEEDVQAKEGDCTDNDGEPALIEAWCTSEGNLSPIPGPDPLTARDGAASTNASAVRRVWHQRSSSSLFSLPFMSTSFSADQTACGGGGATYRPGEARAARPPTRLAATWTTPVRAAERGDTSTDDVWTQAPAVPSRQSGLLAAGSALPGSVGAGIVRGVPLPRASSTSAAGLSPRAFRSPIIYRPS
ncbi:hypothetical protein JIQ42_05794 [Leishmania sp. Namibia]|uniref:hypothetical protein n=1 Tax=Leishmania sp. Namibia TaxID=2802991 RepID=UPI001B778EA9|nr:hypothetical protein JIQ42_05794 [Leishmania sp. Namibia]